MNETKEKEALYLCMGSACHQLGVYEILPKLQNLICKHGLEDRVELKGAFCLVTCSEGVVMKFREQHFTRISAENVEEKFASEILPCIESQP